MKIQIGELSIEVDIDGPLDGPVLILHHSLATSHMMWEELKIVRAIEGSNVNSIFRAHLGLIPLYYPLGLLIPVLITG